MKKRDFLKVSGVFMGGAMLSPTFACKSIQTTTVSKDTLFNSKGTFVLPPLPFPFGAYEPHIDALTMEIHHDKHHGGYVTKLNDGLKGNALEGKSLGEILQAVTADKTQAVIRNNAGGHYNHSLFWEILNPTPSTLEGNLATAITTTFVSKEKMLESMHEMGMKVFGSGWVWLCVNAEGKLFLTSTPNQDNPLMKNIVEKDKQGTPILGIDVWEHAYYLKYQNLRAKYLTAIFNLIDWKAVSTRYMAAI